MRMVIIIIKNVKRLLNFHHSVTCLNGYGAMGARFSRWDLYEISFNFEIYLCLSLTN